MINTVFLFLYNVRHSVHRYLNPLLITTEMGRKRRYDNWSNGVKYRGYWNKSQSLTVDF